MNEKGYFFALLQEHPLIKSIIEHRDFSKVDFNSLVFDKTDEDTYSFKNIEVGGYQFRTVLISISRVITMIKLLTDEAIFFDDPIPYFGQEGFVFEIDSVLVNSVPTPIFRRVFSTLEMLDRTVRLSIYKLGYSYTIKLIFPDKVKIDSIYNTLEF